MFVDDAVFVDDTVGVLELDDDLLPPGEIVIVDVSELLGRMTVEFINDGVGVVVKELDNGEGKGGKGDKLKGKIAEITAYVSPLPTTIAQIVIEEGPVTGVNINLIDVEDCLEVCVSPPRQLDIALKFAIAVKDPVTVEQDFGHVICDPVKGAVIIPAILAVGIKEYNSTVCESPG